AVPGFLSLTYPRPRRESTVVQRPGRVADHMRLPTRLTPAPGHRNSPTKGNADMDVQPIIDKLNTGLFINGQWRDAEGGKTVDVFNPATGKVLTRIADGSGADA